MGRAKRIIKNIKDLDNKYYYWFFGIIGAYLLIVIITGSFTNIFEQPEDTFMQVTRIGQWLQAIGLLVVLWIIVQIMSFVYNRGKWRLMRATQEKVDNIDSRLGVMEKKIDKILKK